MADERLGASFSIDVTQLKAGLAQANRLIRESQSEFKAASAGLDDFTKSQEGLEAKIESLNKIQDIQEEKVKALKKQYEKLIDDGIDPTSTQMVNLRTSINNANADVEKTKKETKKYQKALEELEEGAEDAGDNIEDLGDTAKDSADSLSIFDVAVGNLAASLVSNLGGAIKDSIQALFDLAEETREYRTTIGKLETAFESAGKSAEEAQEVYTELYSVLGDEDKAVEASAHLAKFVDGEQDMIKWTNIATGVWGTFGDSLPIEGLTEAANETVRTGELTGVLTDAINWASEAGETFGVTLKENTKENEEWNKKVEEAKTAEDFFRLALEDCTDEQERQKLITETLTEKYGDAANKFKENNDALIDARKQTKKYNDVIAKLGEKMEPANKAIEEMKMQFLEELVPVVEDDVIPIIEDFMKKLKEDGTIQDFAKGIGNIAKTVLPPLSKALEFAAENIDTLAGATATAVGVYKTFSAAMKITTAISAAKSAIAGLSAGVGLATKAQAGWNAVMAANPIGAVVTAVGLLAGGIGLLVESQEKEDEKIKEINASYEEAVEKTDELTRSFKDAKTASDDMAGAISAETDYTRDLWAELQTLTDENGEVKDANADRAQYILNELNKALDTEYTMNGNIITQYQEMKGSIDKVIEAREAEMLLEAYRDTYVEAIKSKSDAEADRAKKAQEAAKAMADLIIAEVEYQEKIEEAEKLRKESEKQFSTSGSQFAGTTSGARAIQVEAEATKAYEAAKLNLEKKNEAYKHSDATVKEVYKNIDSYETASAALLAGETDKAINTLEALGGGYKTAASVAGESKEKQLEILKQQVIDTEVNLGILEADYKKNQENMTEEEKKQAQARINAAKAEAQNAKNEYYKVGGNLVEGMARGVNDKEWVLTGSLKQAVNDALASAKKVAGIKSPSRVFKKEVGRQISLGIAEGVDDGTDSIISQIKKQIIEMQEAYRLQTMAARVNAGISNSGGNSTNSSSVKSVNVYQTNNYSQAHSRYEIYKVKQQTMAALSLAVQGV